MKDLLVSVSGFLTRRVPRIAAFALAAALLVIVALKGGAPEAIVLGAMALIGSLAGIEKE